MSLSKEDCQQSKPEEKYANSQKMKLRKNEERSKPLDIEQIKEAKRLVAISHAKTLFDFMSRRCQLSSLVPLKYEAVVRFIFEYLHNKCSRDNFKKMGEQLVIDIIDYISEYLYYHKLFDLEVFCDSKNQLDFDVIHDNAVAMRQYHEDCSTGGEDSFWSESSEPQQNNNDNLLKAPGSQKKIWQDSYDNLTSRKNKKDTQEEQHHYSQHNALQKRETRPNSAAENIIPLLMYSESENKDQLPKNKLPSLLTLQANKMRDNPSQAQTSTAKAHAPKHKLSSTRSETQDPEEIEIKSTISKKICPEKPSERNLQRINAQLLQQNLNCVTRAVLKEEQKTEQSAIEPQTLSLTQPPQQQQPIPNQNGYSSLTTPHRLGSASATSSTKKSGCDMQLNSDTQKKDFQAQILPKIIAFDFEKQKEFISASHVPKKCDKCDKNFVSFDYVVVSQALRTTQRLRIKSHTAPWLHFECYLSNLSPEIQEQITMSNICNIEELTVEGTNYLKAYLEKIKASEQKSLPEQIDLNTTYRIQPQMTQIVIIDSDSSNGEDNDIKITKQNDINAQLEEESNLNSNYKYQDDLRLNQMNQTVTKSVQKNISDVFELSYYASPLPQNQQPDYQDPLKAYQKDKLYPCNTSIESCANGFNNKYQMLNQNQPTLQQLEITKNRNKSNKTKEYLPRQYQICRICDQLIERHHPTLNLAKHSLQEHGVFLFVCKICGNDFETLLGIEQHEKYCYKNRPLYSYSQQPGCYQQNAL